MDILSSVVNWEFLSEPLYRWGVFLLVAMPLMFWAWNGVLGFMK